VITTIIPTYNRPRSLVTAIESVLAQTYSDCRAVVYDDGGAAETESMVRELARRDARVVYKRNSRRLGATNNFCRGLDEVDTEYFSFLSDDDRLLPNFYERALAEFRRRREAGVSGGVTLVENASGQTISDDSEWIPAGWYPAPTALTAMLRTRHREWTGLLFRRHVRNLIGSIDCRTAVPDLDYMLRAAGVCNIVLFDDPVAIFTSHPESSTFDLSPRFVYPSYKYLAERLRQDHRIPFDVREWSSRALEARIDSYLIRRGVKAVAAEDAGEARAMIELLRRERGRRGTATLLEALLGVAAARPVGLALSRAIDWKRQVKRWLRGMEVSDARAN
jgi:glycosyltransferase involved in cell wall biosynthesis